MSGGANKKMNWRPLRGIDKSQLRGARLQAHFAAQWLARFARAYISPQPDDEHTNLSWDGSSDEFTTHPSKNGMRLSLQVPNLTLTLHDGNGAAGSQSLSLNGHTQMQVRQWFGECLSRRSLDAGALDGLSPYAIPPHGIAQGAAYDAAGSPDALVEIAAWFTNGEILLDGIQNLMIERKLAASPVRCWPHHFDLSTLTTLPKHGADTAGYVGIGLSPGDEYYDEPYFYVSVYPKPDPSTLPTLPMFGHWHTHEFMAAVVPAHKVYSAKDQKSETNEFLLCATDLALKILS
ncbi:MAG: hypothetical protein ABI830_01160 [Pseudolabrys sp.]